MISNKESDFDEFVQEIKLQAGDILINDKEIKKTRVDSDGITMEWDEKRKGWFPKIDDDFIAQYQSNFGIELEPEKPSDPWKVYLAKIEELRKEKGDDNEEVKRMVDEYNKTLQTYYSSDEYRKWYEEYSKAVQKADINNLKRKNKDALFEDENDALMKAQKEQNEGVPLDQEFLEEAERAKQKKRVQSWYDLDDEKNTHVYVSGLPKSQDFNEEKFAELMSKCGIIAPDPSSNTPRLKLYRDKDGSLKGDGRCCYIKVESVDLALQILDGSTLEDGSVITVERAKFEQKGSFDPNRRRKLTKKDKKKMKEKEENLLKWGIETSKFIRSKKERVVILSNVFVESDFVRDVTLIPLVREKIKVQSLKCGLVKKIIVYDTNKEGIVSLTFNTPEEADLAISYFDKVLFDYPNVEDGGATSCPRQIYAQRWDGKTKYSSQETQEEEEERIARWNSYLDNEDDDYQGEEDDNQAEVAAGESGNETE